MLACVCFQILILLDTTPDQALLSEGVAREVVNRIQKLRKKVFPLLGSSELISKIPYGSVDGFTWNLVWKYSDHTDNSYLVSGPAAAQ